MTITSNTIRLTTFQRPAVPDFPLATTPIERRSRIAPEEFDRIYQKGDCRPVIITDGMNHWPARQKWNFNFFRNRYGRDAVTVGDSLGGSLRRRVNFGEYLTYCELPFATSLVYVPSRTPLYMVMFKPFRKHPELLEDFAMPYFEHNCYHGLKGSLQDWYINGFSWLFIGPRGTLSELHVDLFMTHSWLAQIQGRKHCLLFSPADRPYYEDNMVLTNPDPQSYPPRLRKAKPLEAILEPGETLFVPAGWAHQVVSLSPSITLSFNFVNHSNYMAHILAISRDLPQWVSMINQPAFRKAANVQRLGHTACPQCSKTVLSGP